MKNCNINNISIKWAIYSFIIGISLTASVFIVINSVIEFSIFPFLTLFFAVDRFYRVYTQEAQNEKILMTSWISFLIGVFFYNALTGALHPELGSNFISVTLTLFLSIWLTYKFIFGEKSYSA
jgi:hypothetical protein